MKKKTKLNNVLLFIATFYLNTILSQENPVSWTIVFNDSTLIYNAKIDSKTIYFASDDKNGQHIKSLQHDKKLPK